MPGEPPDDQRSNHSADHQRHRDDRECLIQGLRGQRRTPAAISKTTCATQASTVTPTSSQATTRRVRNDRSSSSGMCRSILALWVVDRYGRNTRAHHRASARCGQRQTAAQGLDPISDVAQARSHRRSNRVEARPVVADGQLEHSIGGAQPNPDGAGAGMLHCVLHSLEAGEVGSTSPLSRSSRPINSPACLTSSDWTPTRVGSIGSALTGHRAASSSPFGPSGRTTRTSTRAAPVAAATSSAIRGATWSTAMAPARVSWNRANRS